MQQATLPCVQAPRDAESAEDIFASQCRLAQLPEFVQQLRFNKLSVSDKGRLREWRFDFAWPSFRLAVEIDGLVVHRVGRRMIVTGRHASVEGINGDNEKINSAILQGWSVLRFTQRLVKPRVALNETMRHLVARGWTP